MWLRSQDLDVATYTWECNGMSATKPTTGATSKRAPRKPRVPLTDAQLGLLVAVVLAIGETVGALAVRFGVSDLGWVFLLAATVVLVRIGVDHLIARMRRRQRRR